MHNQAYFDVALICLLALACIFDMTERRIPNALLLSGLIAAAVLHLMAGPASTRAITFFGGFIVGLAIFLPLYMMRAMAAGDVKLMATVGAFTGPALAIEICLATYCIGGVLALLMVMVSGRSQAAFANIACVLRPIFMRMRGIPAVSEPMLSHSVGGMPYAVAISLGSMLVLWLHQG